MDITNEGLEQKVFDSETDFMDKEIINYAQ